LRLSAATILLSACEWYNPVEGAGAFVIGALIVADLISSYDIIQSRRSLGMKVMRVAIVFGIPIIGILAYLIFERK
jgi:hypothetical protein